MKEVTQSYLDGIAEGRATLKAIQAGDAHGLTLRDIPGIARNVADTCRLFDASNPVGQLLRGERDFWRNQLKRGLGQ